MTNLNDFFVAADLGKGIATTPGGDLDIAGLNFALVLHEEAAPLVERFTTWGLQADAAMVYQTLRQKNQLIIADAGNLYLLEDDHHDDDGLPLSLVVRSIPYPIPTEKDPLTTPKRLWDVMWQTRTPPPASGHLVTVTAFDADNETVFVAVTVLQTTQKVIVRLPLAGVRQWVLQWKLTTNQDFDLVSLGYKYQLMNRRYAAY